MTKGMALLVGLKEVNPASYYGWTGQDGCWGCENDVDNMKKILASLGYEITILKTKKATSNAVLGHLQSAAEQLKEGDIFVFYFSGHGGQQPDRTNDEFDGKDETIVLYDKELVDDSLDKIWPSFKAGVRIVMLSDSCNSGTNYKGIRDIYTTSPIVQFRIDTYGTKGEKILFDRYGTSNDTYKSKMRAQFIHLSGCRDGFGSTGFRHGGAFTLALVDTWNTGKFQGTYESFYYSIASSIRSNQRPQYHEYGPVSDSFRSQRPFTISL